MKEEGNNIRYIQNREGIFISLVDLVFLLVEEKDLVPTKREKHYIENLIMRLGEYRNHAHNQ